MFRRAACLLIFVSALLLATNTSSRADGEGIWRAGARVEIDAQGAEDVWAAGAAVKIRGSSMHDIWAAGAFVDIDAVTGNELWAAGSRVLIKGRVGTALHAAGAEVELGGRVGGQTRLAGASVRVSDQASLSGPVQMAGAMVEFGGHTDSALDLAGEEVTLSGQVEGPVTIRARSVHILDSARISGDLTIFSAEKPDISPQARIEGRLSSRGLEDADWPMGEGDYGPFAFVFLVPPLVMGGSAFLFGLLAVWLTRGSVEQTIDTFMARPAGSALRGLLALILVVLAAILFMVILVGLPLGFALLLVVPAMLIVGFASAGFGVGEWLLNRVGEPKRTAGRLSLLALGVVVLMLVSLIPMVGGLILAVAVLMGLGAVVLTLRDRLSPERPASEFST